MRRDRRPSASLHPARLGKLIAGTVDSSLIPRLVGLGVDVVDLVEFEHNLRLGGTRWLRKLFTDSELNHAEGRIERLGTRFAAKEAVVKALGSGFRAGVSGRAIEIVTDPEGRPRVTMAEAAATVARSIGATEVLVSMSREDGCAVAVAWAVANE